MASNPLIEALLRRAGRGVGQINARGSAIGSALQPFAGQAAGYYSQAQGQESALGGALQGGLSQTGANLGANIGASLRGIQAPQQAVSQFGGGTATMGAQSGAAVGALSSADLQRLQSQGSAEQIYASALPRLAALAADQERRGFLEQMGQELTDSIAELQVNDARQKIEDARYNQEQSYKRKQDARDRKRQMLQDRIERSRYRTTLKQQKKLDALAQYAAQQEYGYKLGNQAISAGNLSERQRHDQATEAAARQREARQRAKDAKAGTGGGADYSDIVKAAKEYGKSQGTNENTGQEKPRLPKAAARGRLKAEFPGATAKQIEQALRAAGY